MDKYALIANQIRECEVCQSIVATDEYYGNLGCYVCNPSRVGVEKNYPVEDSTFYHVVREQDRVDKLIAGIQEKANGLYPYPLNEHEIKVLKSEGITPSIFVHDKNIPIPNGVYLERDGLVYEYVCK